MSDTNQTQEGPRVSHEQMRDLNRLRRSRADRYIAGVSGGLGRHFDIDPTIVRVVFVVLSFFGGAGVILYGAAWLLLPYDDEQRAPFDVSPDTRRVLLIVAVAIAFIVMIGGAWGGFGRFWPIGTAAVIGAVLLMSRDRKRLTQQFMGQRAQAETATNTGSDTVPDAPSASTGPPSWSPPQTGRYVPPPRPRKTGVIWFWPTLALIAIGLGTLGVIDGSTSVPNAAYPALALAITGVMILVGAFVGRPGGLIAIGVISLMTLSATAIVGDGFSTHEHDVTATPLTIADVASTYSTKTGTIHLDLTQLDDPSALGGRTIDAHLTAGEIVVTVPREVTVEVDANIKLAGDIQIDDHNIDHGGINPNVDTVLTGTQPGSILRLDLDARLGQITVRHQ